MCMTTHRSRLIATNREGFKAEMLLLLMDIQFFKRNPPEYPEAWMSLLCLIVARTDEGVAPSHLEFTGYIKKTTDTQRVR